MRKSRTIFRSIVLTTILVLLFLLKGLQVNNNTNVNHYVSDPLDVSKSNIQYISIDGESWPEISDIGDNILLEVNMILKSSDAFSCQNDLKQNSQLKFVVSDSANCETENFNRLIFNQDISKDTLYLPELKSYTQTRFEDYHFSVPIGLVNYIENENSTFCMEILNGDPNINNLEPRIELRAYRERFGDIYFTTMFYDIFFYLVVFLVLFLVIFEIIILTRKSVN